ncbi:50S ribosomal protein L3 [Candidatus Jorgensenbacteria bacterium GWA1_49_17]|uniref:Large ribosomal subunit protein uL3 n=2 Tax=Candidatus Joergenseniibacteriota TaxID=1752739 RepID=A0A1F6BPZ0_9BACT|nr:MAG: 50S ribosomal protein L3 [Candidatus Jorgensenbacteria bacterium GWC1_48_12]OGG40487.1 MAG: 50S ribosomal protein L3 [Candidatus Jorgensenbacteria bacterium GWA1_49_17]
MSNKVLAEKVKMTQIWKDERVVPVTVLKFKEDSDFLKEIKPDDKLRVSGVSKGRGFQGVVKRYGFHGGPKSHGQKDRLRAPGSIGATAPQRVIKGRKMAGHMGNVRVTVRNLVVAAVKPEEKILMVRGAVPGARGTMIEIRKT